MADDNENSPRAARMFEAVQGLERRMGRRVTLDELGAWVADRESREEPYAGSVVRRWLKDLSEPRGTAGWRALADVLGVDPGWLAFGEGMERKEGAGLEGAPTTDPRQEYFDAVDIAETGQTGKTIPKKRGRRLPRTQADGEAPDGQP